MKQISKNFYLGEPITDLREIKRLASEKRSVAWYRGATYQVRPAAFILGWQLNMVINAQLFYTIKKMKRNETESARQ